MPPPPLPPSSSHDPELPSPNLTDPASHLPHEESTPKTAPHAPMHPSISTSVSANQSAVSSPAPLERSRSTRIAAPARTPYSGPRPRTTEAPQAADGPLTAPFIVKLMKQGQSEEEKAQAAEAQARIARRKAAKGGDGDVWDDDERKFPGCSDVKDYEKQEKLGEGTFGVVYKARRVAPDSGRVKKGDVVALKEILVHNESDGMPITSLREIRILKTLDHPNVVPVVDMAYENGDRASFKLGKTFMVFPYMDHDLTGLLENPKVALAEGHVKRYAKQLLMGTAYLHKNGILHRDMKAANLLINNEGILMIADFGLARSLHPVDHDREYTNMVVTRWYRPPELLLGEKKYHMAVDMWGVGCVMVEMFKKKPFFQGTSDLDQANKIFEMCGAPTDVTMPGWNKLPGCEGRRDFGKNSPMLRLHLLPEHGEDFTDLICRILVLNPKKRLTAEEALRHKWFWTPALPTPCAEMPHFPSSHELDKRLREEAHVPVFPPAQPLFTLPPPVDQTRNIPLPSSPAPTWDELATQVKQRFGLENTTEFVLRFTDSDGDLITVSSDVELAELWDSIKDEFEDLKFIVVVRQASVTPTLAADDEDATPSAETQELLDQIKAAIEKDPSVIGHIRDTVHSITVATALDLTVAATPSPLLPLSSSRAHSTLLPSLTPSTLEAFIARGGFDA
ncbi:P-TEFb-associated cyclin-dependent protein kinase Cdk9 [Pseudohyphozyma bogoriensis]|nr:P-TEFb-associated cyclin-dependent protein kinase Cdk9 [Pseudohyphozyma bogoriensis]